MCIDHSEPYVRCLNVSELLGKGRKKSFLFEKKKVFSTGKDKAYTELLGEYYMVQASSSTLSCFALCCCEFK